MGEYDDSRPRSLEQLTARLTAAELRVGRAFFGYPSPGAPSVLVDTDGPAAAAGRLDGVVAAACAAGFAGTPVLTDPRHLATSALRAGLGAELAPLWVVVAGPGTPAAGRTSGAGRRRPGRGRLGRDVRRSPPTGAGSRPESRPDGPPARSGATRRRWPGRCRPGAGWSRCCSPPACAATLPEVRRLLGEYAAWLAGFRDADGQLPGDARLLHPGATPSSTGPALRRPRPELER